MGATCSVWMTTVSITSWSQKNKRGCKSSQMAPSDWILDGDLQTKPRGSWLRWYGGVLSVSQLGVLSSVHICITSFKSAGGWRNYLISLVQSLECSWLLFAPKRETLHHPERCSAWSSVCSNKTRLPEIKSNIHTYGLVLISVWSRGMKVLCFCQKKSLCFTNTPTLSVENTVSCLHVSTVAQSWQTKPKLFWCF